MGRTWEERVGEYVDSPRMRERIKDGLTLICRIRGNSGVYRTQASLGRKKEHGCTCPSDYFPCKHVVALLETYKRKPKSFIDLDKVMKDLEKGNKRDLLGVIRQMALRSPRALTILGLKGFESVEDYDLEVDGW